MKETTNRVQAFLADTLPSLPGFQRNAVQVAYAGSLTQSLSSPGQLHFIEGDTGIGKSLAYSLALADWVARGKPMGRRAIISTHSRALQRQLATREHQDLVQTYLASEGLPPLSYGVRMGRSNYVSQHRLALALGAADLDDVVTDRSRSPVERDLAEWAMDTSGCLLDLDDGALPDGITLADIGLRQHEPLPDALHAHFEKSASADILVINHALLTLDLITGGNITHAETPYALLLDEADRFPEAAESVLSDQLSLRSSATLARRLGAKRAADKLEALLQDWTCPRTAGEAVALEAGQREYLLDALGAVRRARPSLEDASSVLQGEWALLRDTADKFQKRVGNLKDMSTLIRRSPVMGLPSLVALETSAGRCLKSKATSRVTILTSATLSDMQHAPGETPSFDYIRGRLQLGRSDGRMGIMTSHPATDFGELTFCLPSDMPHPLWRSVEAQGYVLSPTFAKLAARRINSLEGRVLVLTNAYADVDALRAAWPAESKPFVSHAPGTAITALAESLPRDAIFVTPAGWEGLSPQRNGRAFWDHLVVLRLPNPSPDPVHQMLLERRLIASGNPPDVATSMATRILANQANTRSIHKLRQGLGRAIRHPDDKVNIVILDPRFPSPSGEAPGEGIRSQPLTLGAIPPRFIGAYRDAATKWPVQGEATTARQEKRPTWAAFF